MYDNRDDFGFKLSIFYFEMLMFLALHPTESISPNSFVLQVHVADFNAGNKLLTQKFLNKAIGIINFFYRRYLI